jgi:calcineurin-like phosphoesterase family protein
MEFFFTSDTHFGHKNVIKYDNRPFSSIEEHDEALIANWNSAVTKKDKVFLVGDFSLTSQAYSKVVLSRLNGQIHLIRGNHDRKLPKDVLSKFSRVDSAFYWRLPSSDQGIYMHHYSCRSWDGSGRRKSWHIFGHVHGALNDRQLELGMSMDVGIMNNDYKLLHLDDLILKFKKIEENLILNNREVATHHHEEP